MGLKYIDVVTVSAANASRAQLEVFQSSGLVLSAHSSQLMGMVAMSLNAYIVRDHTLGRWMGRGGGAASGAGEAALCRLRAQRALLTGARDWVRPTRCRGQIEMTPAYYNFDFAAAADLLGLEYQVLIGGKVPSVPTVPQLVQQCHAQFSECLGQPWTDCLRARVRSASRAPGGSVRRSRPRGGHAGANDPWSRQGSPAGSRGGRRSTRWTSSAASRHHTESTVAPSRAATLSSTLVRGGHCCPCWPPQKCKKERNLTRPGRLAPRMRSRACLLAGEVARAVATALKHLNVACGGLWPGLT